MSENYDLLLNDDINQSIITSALELAKNQLYSFANSPDFQTKMQLAFGVAVDSNSFQIAWQNQDFSVIPNIEVRTGTELGEAIGAYAQATNTIYLSQDYLNQNAADIESITSVLLEEIGHAVDAKINILDTPGEEGAIFSGVVQGKTFEPEQLQQLKAKDDYTTITLDGQIVQIEQASISDSGGEGGTNKTIQLDPLPAGQTNKGNVTVKYSYEHFSIPDQFTIRYEGKNIFDTGGLVSGSRSGSVTFERGNSDVVEVKVTAPEDGTAWEFSVNADDCADTTPLNIEAVGGDFKDNDGDGDCEFNGTVTIGRTDGTAKLIRIEGASVEYDKKEVRVKNGTVFPVIGGISKPLFKGDFTIPFAEGKSSSFAESGKSSAGFKLAGLDVDFNKIILDKNAINLGASFALPLEIAENPIRVSLTPDSSSILDIPNGLIIDNSGLRLGVAGGVKLPNVPKDFKLFNLIKVSTSDLNISYSNSDDAIKLQGKVQLSPFSRLKTPKTIEADLTKDNFIQIKDGKPDFVGSISAKNIPLIKGWNLPELKLFLDTTKNIVEGDVSVTFPFGKQPVLFRKSVAQVGIGVGFQNFELNAIRGNLTLPQPGIPIATTGFFVESLGGGIRNLAPSSKDPIEFTGSAKIVSRLAAGLASLDASATISSEKLSGSGKFEFIARDIVSADVSAELDWNKEKFSAKGDFSFFDGLLKANTGLKLNSNFDFSINGKASATIPKAFRGKKIPLIGGKSLPSISFLVDYKNDSTLSNDFGAIWGSFPISVPGTSIQRDVSVGLKVFFDGDVDVLFGSKLLPETNSFQVAPGSQYIILSSDWENSNPNVKVRIKKPDGSFIDEADFAANNISIFAEFTDEDTRSVVIANPTPGIWDIVVVDPNGLGEIVYSGIGDSVVPTIEITSPTTDATSSGIVNIGFNAVDSDSTAKIKLFYDDDNTGLDGLLITDSLLENDGDGTFAWNTEGVPTGDYFIYAMIMDDENIPVFSNYSAGKIKVTESADLELNKVVFGNDPITNSNFTYQLSVTNNGTSISKDVFLQDSLPTEVTFISASTIPSQQTGSDLIFNLGDIAPGATQIVDITVKAPTTALTLLNTAEVISKTFDPFIGNNFATLSTTVDVIPTPLADLSVTANPISTNLKIGDRITYDFVVTNNGTANASGVVFQTNFTANAGGVQNLSANIGRVNRDVVTANLGSLASGQSRTVSVSADLTAAGTLTTTADVSGNELDPSTLNNSLILQKNVEAIALVPADLELSLTSDKTTANIDDIVTLRLTLTNKGIGAATSIKVKQVLASGLTFVSSNPQQGTYDSVSGIWDAGNIAKDNRAFIDIVTKVTSGGSLLNTAEIIAVAETDPDSTPNNNNPNEDDQASVTLNAALATPTLAKTADDIFTISGGSGNKPKLQVTPAGRNSNLVNELAVFTVDDAQGKINGIAPGETGYTQAALNKSKVIFSTIANIPNGFDINNLTSLIEFESGNNLRFLLVKNGTIDSVQNGITPTSDILFSDLSRQKITDLGTDGFSLAWKDGSNNNTDFKDLVVNIKSTDDSLPLGTNLQGKQQGEVLDLRGITNNVKADFTVNREAAFNNFVGFYQVADENGGIDVDGNGTVDFRPGDSGYAQAAIKNRVAGIDLRVDNQGTGTFTDKTLTGGSIFAPFILTNGRTVDQVLNGQVDQAYFAYLGANSDKVDHIRLLGNNVFGFEDLAGGGDKDYNDIIVKVNLSVV